MKKKTIDWKQYFPAGIDVQKEINWLTAGFFFSCLMSVCYFGSLYNQLQILNARLDLTSGISGIEVTAPEFCGILKFYLIGFTLLAVYMLFLAVYHYLSHFQGSKSIYLMKRLPNRRELAKRCLAAPLFTAVLSLGTSFILRLIYFGIYLIAMPKQYLPDNLWQSLWNI